MPETWTAVIVTADAELTDSLASFLIDRGAPGVITEDLPRQRRITAHFAGAAPVAALERFCTDLGAWFPGTHRPVVRVEVLPSADWAESWKEHFPPLLVGERLFIHPPWVHDVPPGRLGIELNPGLAFGTGHHASTRGCLLLLERVMREQPVGRVLDLGTGSGILAIAAAKLGAAEVWAVDVDEEACTVAMENARTNAVAEAIRVRSSLHDVPGRFDVVLANLFAQQLIDMAPTLWNRLASGPRLRGRRSEAEARAGRPAHGHTGSQAHGLTSTGAHGHPNGVAIGAGVLAEEAAAVESAWRRVGLAVETRHQESEWVTLRARRT